MRIIDSEISDVKIVEPAVFGDDRGYFFESFNQRKFDEAIGRNVVFVQDNHSKSARGVVRGLHYQLDPHAQGKLVRVVKGEVYDVAVDLRRSSATFGKWVGFHLTEDNKRQVWIPEGFAHGFIVLSETAEFLYKATDYWHKESERAIVWNCPHIGIDWPCHFTPRLSPKDMAAPHLIAADVFS